MKTVLKVILYIILFHLLSAASLLAGAFIYAILGLTIGIWINPAFLFFALMVLFISLIVSKKKEKERLKAAATKKTQQPSPAAKEPTATDKIAAKLDVSRRSIERSARKIKDKETASKVKSIAATLNKIARDIEHDPRDRNKVRGLADNCGDMIESLIDRYIRLEGQDQASENISSTMFDIRAALTTVDDSLKVLLDDLFTNDANEVNSEIAVLEKLLKTNSPENRISMKGIKSSTDEEETSKAAPTMNFEAAKEEVTEEDMAEDMTGDLAETLSVITHKLDESDMAEAKSEQ